MPVPSLLDALGGDSAVAVVVADLYERVLADPMLAPYFDGIDLDRQRQHLADFLVAVLGGPGGSRVSDQKVLRHAHAPLHVTDDAFDTLAAYLLNVLLDAGAAREIAERVVERIAELRPYVVTQA